MSGNAAKGAGYSGTPLAKKLGIKEGMIFTTQQAPEHYDELLEPLPGGAVRKLELEADETFVHAFFTEAVELEERLVDLANALAKSGCLWISWPKKAAKVKTDLNGNVVRRLGLEAGLVDVKVCAVDATWSGLKFVYRLKDR